MIKLEIDIGNRKKIKKLEAENLILKSQLANYRNTLLEYERRNTKQGSVKWEYKEN